MKTFSLKGGTMATIKDSQRAGLSISTVSRYLNHHPYISENKKIKNPTSDGRT